MTKFTEERAAARLACRTFIALSAVIATYGVWQKGIFPAALGITAMLVCLWLLSQAIERVREALANGHRFTAIVAGVLAAGFVLLEANLNHIGLELLNAEYTLAPDIFVWPACIFISLVNVFGDYGFARALEKKNEPQRPALVAPLEEVKNPHAVAMAEAKWRKARGG